jgi:hypothetical protein
MLQQTNIVWGVANLLYLTSFGEASNDLVKDISEGHIMESDDVTQFLAASELAD